MGITEQRRRLLVVMGAALLVAIAGSVVCSEAARSKSPHQSLSHPLSPSEQFNASSFSYISAPIALADQSKDWSLFSGSVNVIRCFAERGEELWLGTDRGVKLVDRKRGIVRHFTRLDGLPDDKVLAVTTQPNAVWCLIAIVRESKSFAALCRFNPKTELWEVASEFPRPSIIPPGASAYENVATGENWLCVVLGPVLPSSEATLHLFDRRRTTWRKVSLEPGLRADHRSLNIQFMDAERDAVWLGTQVGLLVYDTRKNQWQRHLPDRVIYGWKREGESLWLASALRTGNSGAGDWKLTRFTPRTGETRDYERGPAPNRTSTASSQGGLPTGVSLAEGGVWVTTSTAQGEVRIVFHRFNPTTGQVRTLIPRSDTDLEFVPDAALHHPLGSRNALAVQFAQKRFASWFCANATEAMLARRQAYASSSWSTTVTEEGTTWTVSDYNVLVRTAGSGSSVERYPLSSVNVRTNPPIYALTLNGGTLFLHSPGGVQSLNLKSGELKQLSLPNTFGLTSATRMVSDGASLWLGSNYVLQYGLTTEQIVMRLSDRVRTLLGANRQGLWLAENSTQLVRSTGEGQTVERVDLQLPMQLRVSNASRPRPIALTDDIVWCLDTVRTSAGSHHALIGYNTKSSDWIEPLPVDSSFSPLSVAVLAGDYYAASSGDSPMVQRYSSQTRRWSMIAPNAPADPDGFRTTYSIVSAADNEIWCLDLSRLVLWSYNRLEKSWSSFRCPGKRNVVWQTDAASRWGDTILVASAEGLWQFDLVRHEWQPHPIRDSSQWYLMMLASEPSAVWALCRTRQGEQYCAARFDRVTKKWTTYGQDQGFPSGKYPVRIVTDGETAWLLSNAEAYRFDPKTEHWRNISRRLSVAPDQPTVVGNLTSDQDSVWLLLGTAATLPNIPSAPNSLGLARYHKTTDRLELLRPHGHESVRAHYGVWNEANAIWIPTSVGVYRFDKGSLIWRRIELPAHYPSLEIDRVARIEGALWFFARDNSIRWTQE